MNEPFIRFSHVKVLLYRYWLEYKQVAKGFLITDLMERLLYFVAFGYGLGRALREISGVSYLEFIIPGIVGGSLVFTMTMAMTYGVYERSKLSSVWFSWLATPIRLQEILFAELSYAALRSFISVIVLYAVAFGLGAITSFKGALLALPILFLSSYVYGAVALWMSSYLTRILYMGYVKSIWMMPMYLFGGVFFDVSTVPDWMFILAQFFPLTHVLEIVRPLFLGQPVDMLYGLCTLVGMVALFTVSFYGAYKQFYKRMFV